MDQVVLTAKLESLRRCVERVEEKCPSKLEELEKSPDLQDILVLNLTRAVQLCVDIGSHIISENEIAAPTTMGEVFERLVSLELLAGETGESMRKAVGFRNIAIHNYEAINWEIVHAICIHSPADFTDYARAITALIDSD
jgi:uncharacterized protein YutE (UPF0331/DUF86 family)